MIESLNQVKGLNMFAYKGREKGKKALPVLVKLRGN